MNVKVELVVQVVVLTLVRMKVKKRYDEKKTEKMIFVKWICEHFI